ncbi:MAG: hypothetical protein HFI75_07080 [Lachnospiraceae bacterium]|nr:hypothetical protein [Lachnospiraceae bacterium]
MNTETQKINLFSIQIPVSYLVLFLMIQGIFVRLFLLGTIPGGLNQDEAFSGYEAYSLLHYGMDSSGYSFPVYLTTWGSGMSALNSYLMIPFMALFGAQTWVLRLPQALTACISLFVCYKLLYRLFDVRTALLGLLLLTICPWHIIMARWGLDCNLAPGFLLFGLYFFVCGMDHPKFFMLSALFYGLSLYCYATIWPLVPLILCLQCGYLLYTGKLRLSIYLLFSVLILALLALPLLCFLLVNNGYMDEVRTSFFSIPKMPYMRTSDISFARMPENFNQLCSTIFQENDQLYWNAAPETGLYGKGVLFLAVLGFAYCVKRTVCSFLTKTFDGSVLIWIQFLTAVLLGCVISININRINCIHLPILMMAAIGLNCLLRISGLFFRYSSYVVTIMYLILFLLFISFYFDTYAENIGSVFQEGLEDSVSFAMELAEDSETEFIEVASDYCYSKILFYSRLPVTEYLDTVTYTNYPSAFLALREAGPFRFGISQFGQHGIFIIPAHMAGQYRVKGYGVEIFGNTAVAWLMRGK